MEEEDNENPRATGGLVEVGVVARPHGVRGQVKLHLHNPRSELFVGGGRRAVVLARPGDPPRRLDLEAVAATRGALVARLSGVEDRDAAEALRGSRVLVPREQLDPPGEGQYYYADLVGCVVVDDNGESVGTVHQVFETGASDVLVVRDGGLERYIPLVDEWVGEVDLERRRIWVRDIDQWDTWPVGR